jgi:hypothetical protein
VKQQIPFRNDRKKSKGNCNSGFPPGMTRRKARAKTSAKAKGSLAIG